jgi:hypothetical protein
VPLWIAVRPLNSSASTIFWYRNSSLSPLFFCSSHLSLYLVGCQRDGAKESRTKKSLQPSQESYQLRHL